MKRSSFLKTLLGIAIAPKVLGEVKQEKPSIRQYPLTNDESFVSVDWSDIKKFSTVPRKAIAGMIYPSFKSWKTIEIINKETGEVQVSAHAITFVDKEIDGVHYAIHVRSMYNGWGIQNSNSTEQKCMNGLRRDVFSLMKNDYKPNPHFDTIIIG